MWPFKRRGLDTEEMQKMADFAASLRRNGYLGYRVGTEALDRVLICSTGYQHMVDLVEMSVAIAMSEERSRGGRQREG